MNEPRLRISPRNGQPSRRITEFTTRFRALLQARGGVIVARGMLLTGLLAAAGAAASTPPDPQVQREAFQQAWQAASRGDRAGLERGLADLQGYLLHPYLRYEDLRSRRSRVDADEMARFLQEHRDWAFAAPLKRAWLKSLGAQGHWGPLLANADETTDTELRCMLAEARLATGDTAELLPLARELWTVGRSQPDECDPVFAWLQAQGGITASLAWERVRLAMEERQPRLTLYLARFLPEPDRAWVDRWYQQDRAGYRRLDQAVSWPQSPQRRQITEYGLRRLARNDADRAWAQYQALDGRIEWSDDQRAGILREIALWSAVAGSPGTPERMQAVPVAARDDRLLEWWARHDLGRAAWAEVLQTIAAMSGTARDDGRWRYWRGRALLETGDRAAGETVLGSLALEASYHGFLAADLLGLPYTICAEAPSVTGPEVEAVDATPGIQRALELRRAGIRNWARSEWLGAARGLDTQGLRAAAAVAVREEWPEMAIFALGDSGDRQWYEWRFPVDYWPVVDAAVQSTRLDGAWVMGLMRSESAMAVDALSSAGAYGLMQVLPGTASQLSRQHGITYSGREQLLQPADNVRFGTTYLRDLLDRYGGNPVLATGAYNAGPGAVDRWLAERPTGDPAIWIETLPYFETRDYIPRVLAFTTLYDWRLQRDVGRVSARMPAFHSAGANGTIQAVDTAEVVCRAAG